MQIMTALILLVVAMIAFLVFMFFWDKPVMLIYIQVVYSCCVWFFMSRFGFPSMITYLLDVINIYLVLLTVFCMLRKYKTVHFGPAAAILLGFFGVTILGLIINEQPIVLYIWGFRNIFRFFFFFFSAVMFLKMRDLERLFNIFTILLFASVVFASHQYFILGYRDDLIGGVYGTIKGCNAGLQLLISVVSIFAVVMFLNKKITTKKMMFIVLSCFYLAVISELKVFFVQVVLVVFAGIFFSKKGKRSLAIVAVFSIGLITAYSFLVSLYPVWQGFFEPERLIDYTSNGYSSEGELNRLTGVSSVMNDVFTNDYERLIGVGLGNADYSSYFVSEFFQERSYLRYDWFYSTFMIVENGVVGMLVFLSFFCYLMAKSIRMMGEDKERRHWLVVTIVSVIMYFLLFFYSVGLRMDCCYIYVIPLVIPLIIDKEKFGDDQEEEMNQIQNEYV